MFSFSISFRASCTLPCRSFLLAGGWNMFREVSFYQPEEVVSAFNFHPRSGVPKSRVLPVQSWIQVTFQSNILRKGDIGIPNCPTEEVEKYLLVEFLSLLIAGWLVWVELTLPTTPTVSLYFTEQLAVFFLLPWALGIQQFLSSWNIHGCRCNVACMQSNEPLYYKFHRWFLSCLVYISRLVISGVQR
jgi:hypothetical protein